MGRSISDNFKKRFGDPARIEVRHETGKVPPSEDTYRSEQLSKACVEVLRGVLGREPTQDEILGTKDISTRLQKK